MYGGKLLGILYIIVGIHYYFHPKFVLYGFPIDWSYMNIHIFFALIFILLGGFLLYRNIFHTK